MLLVVAASWQVLLAAWAARSPPEVVRRIALLLPYWLIWFLLLLNTGLCFWRRLPALRRETGREPLLGAFPPTEERPDGPETAEAAELWMRRRGLRTRRDGEGRVLGLRGRWGALGSFAFHGAFFLLAAGFLLTMGARQEARVRIAEGETHEGGVGQLVSATPPRLLAAGVPATHFAVQGIEPEFWQDRLLFTRLEARLALPGGREELTRINDPVWTGPFTTVRLAGFGHAPRYELRDREGRLIDSAFTKLEVFPPGRRDWFEIPSFPHRFHVELFPEAVAGERGPATRSMNLRDPALLLTVFRGRLRLSEALLRPGQQHEFEGLQLSFPELRYWGEFSILFDPGAPVLWLGHACALLGLALKLRGEREEAEWQGGRLRLWRARDAGCGPGETAP